MKTIIYGQISDKCDNIVDITGDEFNDTRTNG